jgi:hypothetical protein
LDDFISTRHFVADFGQAYRETDLAEADLGTIAHNLISGEYRNPLRIVAFNTVQGWSRDLSEEIAYDVLDRAYDPDTTLRPVPSGSSTGM